MAKRKARTRKTARAIAANKRNPEGLSHLPKFGRPDFLILLGLAAVTFGIYAQVTGHEFIILDDEAYIKDNVMVNRGLSLTGIAWAFTTFEQANWHPLTWIVHMIDCQLFGLDAGGHLLVSALIHTANTLLLFCFLLRATRARWASALIAALFALHPMHVESVAWAAELKDTLCTFFGLLSLIAYVRYTEEPSRRWYAWVAITLALGLLAKPMLVTWPFVMLLVDYWPLHRLPRSTTGKELLRLVLSLLREKAPLIFLVAASAVITFVAQSQAGAVQHFTNLSLAGRLGNVLVSYAKYILLSVWPHDLAVYYPLAPAGLPAAEVVPALLLLIGITTFCFVQRNVRPYFITGWFWFLGTLIPVIGIVQVGGQSMADRYSYIPSIGLFIGVVFGLADIATQQRVPASLSAATAGGILLVLAALTNAQIQRWHDSVSLFQHALAVTSSNDRTETNLGLGLLKTGRYDEAAPHLERALQFDPNDYDNILNIGYIRVQQNRFRDAIECYQSAIRLQPGTPKAHVRLGLVLWKQGRNDAACDELRLASQLAPKDASIRADFGLALERVGKISEGMEQLQEALRLNPSSAEAHNNLGLALLALGKPGESIAEFQAALRLKPDLKIAADNLRRAQGELK
jgi:Flp pilus assembly protein TadD